jgi:DNA helicase HerA-like ATPase
MSDTLPFSTAKLEGLARSIEAIMDAEDPAQIIGKDLTQLAARIPSDQQVTPGAVVRLSLLNDTLCVAERAIKTDGRVSSAEIEYVGPLVGETQKYLGRFRELYREVDAAGEHGVRHFLEQHASDGQKFGGRCKSTAWIGLSLCQRAAELTGDQHFVEDYRDLVVRMLDDLFGDIGSGNESDKQAVVQELNRLAPPVAPEADLRELAYCSASSPEVFHAVAHGADVFEPDPLDVEKIHAEARASFSRLLQRASDANHGKMLLVKGVAGSGKTHLMRAFRNHVHGGELGFVAYLQMSTRVANYSRYVLANLIDSWDRPYYGNVIGDPAITCLSDSLVRDLPRDAGEHLRSDALGDSELDLLVNRSADRLLSVRKYGKLNVDLLRALLYLQRRDPPRRARVLKFLRCEPFSAYDRQLLGGVSGPEDEHAPARMLADLGQLVNATGNGALVLLVDQLEDIYHLDEAPNRFRVAMDALRHITDHVPTSIIVIACLDDFYTHLRSSLAKPMLDRLEHDPDPVTLTASRSRDEIEEIIEPRLQRLFEHHAVRIRDDQPLFPFSNAELDALVNQRTRDVLEWCRAHHEASVRAGKIQAPSNQPAAPSLGQTPDLLNLAQEWNDFWPSSSGTPQDEPEMLQLIAWALDHVGDELPSTEIAARAQGNYVSTDAGAAKLVVGLCDRPPQGGALGKQVDALREQASSSHALPVALRSSEYPRPGSSQVSQKLKGLLQDGGRRVVITDTEWRRLHALRGFMSQRPDTPEMKAWLQQDRPLLGVSAIREILDLDGDSAPTASPPKVASPAERLPSPPTPVASPANDTEPSDASFVIGQTRALSPRPVSASAADFSTHAAFLGTTKSGKTTLALGILEQLLARQVPVLMIDRKGDLCRYGAADFWREPIADRELAARKAKLQQSLDVRVYTPGEPRGRGLDLPVIPSGMKELPAHERGIAAQSAASALGSMMGYGKSQADRTRLSILGKAIELIGQNSSAQRMGIPQLVSLLDDEDPDLVSAVGKLDPKHFRALVENLETLRLRHDHLLRNDSERLAPEELFGKAERSGRTRLSVISTKFIGDNSAVDFWVARLLGELTRWASRNPANALQGELFLDEADIYLPAQSKPATKEPLLDLLKRGRSAGLGVFLATQSPGDLDYRCRDNIRSWFVGRVAEKTAVDKMKPLLSESRIHFSSKLALAKTGEFFRLEEGEVLEFKAGLSLLATSQVPEDEILKLAASGARASASGRVAKR